MWSYPGNVALHRTVWISTLSSVGVSAPSALPFFLSPSPASTWVRGKFKAALSGRQGASRLGTGRGPRTRTCLSQGGQVTRTPREAEISVGQADADRPQAERLGGSEGRAGGPGASLWGLHWGCSSVSLRGLGRGCSVLRPVRWGGVGGGDVPARGGG